MYAERGRVCPVRYHHGPEALRAAAARAAGTAWIVGGLYGNVEAIDALCERVARDERAGLDPLLVLNGDFHWFDVDPGDFRAVQDRAMDQVPLAGNVEAELGDPDETAGCGCAYPDFVDDATVARSNAIMDRLQGTATTLDAGVRQTLAALPYVLRLHVGGRTIGVVHGDPDTLAGWALAVERLAPRGGTTGDGTTAGERVRDWARRAAVDAFACSHTCLPWTGRPGGVPVINNGSGGMPNFRGRLHGLAARVAPAGDAAPDAVVGIESHGLHFELVPIAYDHDAWRARFERCWPPGSPAHRSYFARITEGPAFEPADALPDV